MDSISIRYGEYANISIDVGDPAAISADFYIGKPGEAYIITQHAALTGGVGTFAFTGSQMEIPLGTYFYQINVNNQDGSIEKLPSAVASCDDCDSTFPEFMVYEALDEIEVS